MNVGKVYISGAITGTDDYMEHFDRAERELIEEGFTVVNPARILSNMPAGTTHEEYMKLSIELLKMCEFIYMLKGWEDSTGANREYGYALASDIIILRKKMKKIDADLLMKVLHITDNDNDNRAQCINLYSLKKVILSMPECKEI